MQQPPQPAAEPFPAVRKGFPPVAAAFQRQPRQGVEQIGQLKQQGKVVFLQQVHAGDAISPRLAPELRRRIVHGRMK